MTWRFWGGREEEVTVTDSIQQKTTWKHFYSSDTEKKQCLPCYCHQTLAPGSQGDGNITNILRISTAT